ncbi:hypothetical protein B0T19DRAFT_296617 [Cercophora scortea]|uniref:Uncharacterized protein n=1 Tax=Cercophora scortea TaxID=314031 RepID=A0AAE0M381_9PEZI|nr:hypothetical protein B0T19DRAFT_296617 [Cercophora scortea]
MSLCSPVFSTICALVVQLSPCPSKRPVHTNSAMLYSESSSPASSVCIYQPETRSTCKHHIHAFRTKHHCAPPARQPRLFSRRTKTKNPFR